MRTRLVKLVSSRIKHSTLNIRYVAATHWLVWWQFVYLPSKEVGHFRLWGHAFHDLIRIRIALLYLCFKLHPHEPIFPGQIHPCPILSTWNYANLDTNFADVSSQNGRKYKLVKLVSSRIKHSTLNIRYVAATHWLVWWQFVYLPSKEVGHFRLWGHAFHDLIRIRIALLYLCFKLHPHEPIFPGQIHPCPILSTWNYANLDTNFADVSSQNGRKYECLPTSGLISCSFPFLVLSRNKM